MSTKSDDHTPNRRSFLRILGVAPGAGFVAGLLLACGDDAGSGGGSPDGGSDANGPDGGRGDGGPLPDGGGGDLPGSDVEVGGDGAESCVVTGSDVEGPFFVEGAPERTVLADQGEDGERLFIGGTVYRSDGCTPVAGALLDIWQADAEGNYHDETEDYRLRGQTMSDNQGRWSIETIRPGHYLNAGAFRPAHIHFTVTRPGLTALTTQMYFAGDPYLQPNDSCGTCNSGDPTLIIELTEVDGVPDAMEGTFDIVLAA